MLCYNYNQEFPKIVLVTLQAPVLFPLGGLPVSWLSLCGALAGRLTVTQWSPGGILVVVALVAMLVVGLGLIGFIGLYGLGFRV